MGLGKGTIIEASTPEFANRCFEIKKQLGKGGEGQVFLAKPQFWNKDFDVALKLSNQIKQTELQFIQKLISIQNDIERQESKSQIHTNIIRIYDSFQFEKYSVQVMEVGSKNLFTYMKDNQNKLTNLQKFKICKQLLNAIYFIHQEGLIHRDIKGENFILVNEEFKLIDFGLMSLNNRMMTSKQGTRIFQAPEIFEEEGNYTQSLDIWALGCVFYEIIKEEELFPCTMMLLSIQQIKNHKKDQRHVYLLIDGLRVCDEWKNLLKQMLHPKQFDRIKIEQAIKQVNYCIAKEENNGMAKGLVNNFQINNDQQDVIKFELEQKFNLQQQELNQVIREKDLLIKKLQNKIEQLENDVTQYQDDIESLKKKVNKFEQERNKFEQERNKLEQDKEKYEELILEYQQHSQQLQNQMNYQITQINNQQTQQLNQQRQILDNEIKNLRNRVQQLEQENQQLQKKLNQSKDEESTQNSINKEIIFLDKLIKDITNEISNLMNQLDSFKNIKQILSSNNTLLNSQIEEIEQQLIDKNKNLSNYEKIKFEIQNLDQSQQKQQSSDVLKNNFDIKIQQDITSLQKQQGIQQLTNYNSQSQIQYQFKPPIGNFQMQPFPPQGFPPQGYPPQGFPPQGYLPQGFPPQGYPPTPYQNMMNSQIQYNQNQQ
ncbi:unnamed protein product [Paramecium primaurelia]|uniref:Rhodopsin n=1 Tax=Paramecium primaurelia TaxID=5886 RepID=A0A8S1N8R7_PARPR|nr:unnamed protein product [Paramecium primaurelia]